MIVAHCRTNLNDYSREEWPEIFQEVPRKGDYVRSDTGRDLKVVGITHCVDVGKKSYIIVELNG